MSGLNLHMQDLTVDGVTATSTEVNKLAGVTPGTAAASKAAVLGANKNLDVLALPVGGLAIGAGAGTPVTPTAAELNRLAAASPGVDGGNVSTLANVSVLGVPGILITILVADASANTDVVLTRKMQVLDAWGLNTGIAAHATADTWQVKNGASAISDPVAKTATVNALKRISTIDPAQAQIAAGGTLRIAAVHSTNAAVTVCVLLVPVA